MKINIKEIESNLERSEQSLKAAKELLSKGYYDFAASRTYYTAFYASCALLFKEGVDMSKHSGVIASIHQLFVKTGRLEKERGKDLNWLFELRNIGDYGVSVHVSKQDAERAVLAAEKFLQSARLLIK